MSAIDASQNKELLDRKLKQITEAISRTSTTISVLIFTLAVTWLLGLEVQITRIFLRTDAPRKSFSRFQKDLARIMTEQERNTAALVKAQKRLKSLKHDTRPNTLKDFETADNERLEIDSLRDKIEKNKNEAQSFKKKRAELTNEMDHAAREISKLKTQAESVEFKLPVIDVKVPRLAAPFCWCLVSLGTVVYVCRVRRRIHRLSAEAFSIAGELDIPLANLTDTVSEETWWLHPYPRCAVRGWRPLPWSFAIWIFWAALVFSCLRVLCLGLHSLAFEDEGSIATVFFLLSSATVLAILYLLYNWSRTPPGGPEVCGARRQMLFGLGAFVCGAIFGKVLHVLFKPDTLTTLAAKIESLRPKRNGGLILAPRRRFHIYPARFLPAQIGSTFVLTDDEGSSRALPGVFVRSASRKTIHYIFPSNAYAENSPKMARSKSSKGKRPRLNPHEPFVRWGEPPKKWGEVVSASEILLLTPALVRKRSDHVAYATAASAFEHAIFNIALGQKNLSLAIDLGLSGVRHDLAVGHGRPNFRIYDLTAGLILHSGDRAKLAQLAELINNSPKRKLFTKRLAKWLSSDNKWVRRWSPSNAVSWAMHLIS